MPKPQVFVAKGSTPWYSNYWEDAPHVSSVIGTYESKSAQATVTCDGNVTNMCGMFSSCYNLTSLDLSNFNTSSVTNMRSMFESCSNLVSLDVSNVNTSNVTVMDWMFNRCSSIVSIDLSSFNTSNVTKMRHMFSSCTSLTSLDLSSFDTSKVTDMGDMFTSCYKLASLDLSSFDTSKVDDMSWMFGNCSSLTFLDISNFDTSKVTNMDHMFYNCDSLVAIKGIIDMKSCKNCYDMFKWCTKLKNVKIKNPPADFENKSGLSKSQYTIVDNEADSCKKGSKYPIQKIAFIATGSAPWYGMIWADESHVIDVIEFLSSQAIVTIDDEITNMEHMFYHCSGLTSLDLFSYFNTSKITNMCGMFNSCFNLTALDLSGFNTSKVTNMSFMFFNCHGLTSLDLSSFNTSNVDDMECMFGDCTSLTAMDLSNFDTSKVKNMSYMFKNCYNLTTIKGVIDMKSCKWCTDMFKNCPKLKGVKIKNPPTEFNEHWVGLSKSQYTIVDDESDSLKRRNNMFKTTGIEPIDGIDIPINIYRVPDHPEETIICTNYIPSNANNDAPKYDKATQEVDDKKEEAMSDFNKSVKELSNKLDEIVNKNNSEESSPKKEEVSTEAKAEDHKPTNEEKVQKAIDDEEINKEKIYNVLKNFIYESDFIPAFLWFMEHAYNNVSFAHQHKRRVYKIYKEIIKGGNLFGKCIGDLSDEQGNCAFFMNGSDRALKDFQYNRQAKAAKLLAKFIIASNTTPYVLDLISYYEDSDMDCYTAIPTAISDIRMVYKSELYVKTLEKVCFGRDF